jgi:hypothetical protein
MRIGHRLVLVALILAFARIPLAQSPTCPVDDSSAYFTGKTKTDRSTGKLLYEYKCNRAGHLFWVVKRS